MAIIYLIVSYIKAYFVGSFLYISLNWLNVHLILWFFVTFCAKNIFSTDILLD